MRSALFPGTFDPPTLGHLDIIERSANLVEKIWVGVAVNTSKAPFFSVEQRIEMMREITKHLSNVEVVTVDGLVADYAKNNSITVIIRGIRSASDCDSEFAMALANRKMSGVETLFLTASDHLSHLSASLIREIAASGKYLEAFVPNVLASTIYSKFNKL